MSEEPDFIAQNGDPMTEDERDFWLKERLGDAITAGATFFRASVHEAIPNLVLFEGWKVPPKDHGEPRWQLMRADEKNG